jgi:hypothetical protein
VHIESGPDEQGLAPPTRPLVKPKKRVTLEAQSLSEQAIGERIARLASTIGRLIQ